MRAASLALFMLALLQTGLGQQHRRVTLLVRPSELVPAATRVSVSGCDALPCVAREVKRQLGLDGPEYGLGRRVVLTPALVEGRDAVPVPFESLDEIDDVAKVQLWLAQPEPECEQLLAAERDAALREQRAAVVAAQAAAADSSQDAGDAHQLAAALRDELAESQALVQSREAQLKAARAQVDSSVARATDAEKMSRELREQLEHALADLTHSQTQLSASVDRITTVEAELKLAQAHTQRAVEDCEEGAADRVATACVEEENVIASLKLQQAQQQAAAEECSATLLTKSEEAAAAESARQEQADQCAAKLRAAEASKSEAAATADQIRRENLAAAKAACDDTTKAVADEARVARAELHEAEQRCAEELTATAARAAATANDECICIQEDCEECPACAACPEPRSLPVECPECPVCQTCHPCECAECPQCKECHQCPTPTEDKECPEQAACKECEQCEQCEPCADAKECQPCPEQAACKECEQCEPCADAKECQPCPEQAACKECEQCELCADAKECQPCPEQAVCKECEQCEPCADAKECQPCEACPESQECPDCLKCQGHADYMRYGAGFQGGTAVAHEMLTKVADQAQATYMKAPKLADVVETVTNSVADVAKAVPRPNLDIPTVEMPTVSSESIPSPKLPTVPHWMISVDADVLQTKIMNITICVALMLVVSRFIAETMKFARAAVGQTSVLVNQLGMRVRSSFSQDEGVPPELASSEQESTTSTEGLWRLTPSELENHATWVGLTADEIQDTARAKDKRSALIGLIMLKEAMTEVPEAVPPVKTPQQNHRSSPDSRSRPQREREREPEPEPELQQGPTLEPDSAIAELEAILQTLDRADLKALATAKNVPEQSIEHARNAEHKDALIELIVSASQGSTLTGAAAGAQPTLDDDLGLEKKVAVLTALTLVIVFDASVLFAIVLALLAVGAVRVGWKKQNLYPTMSIADQRRKEAIAQMEKTLRLQRLSPHQLEAEARGYNLDATHIMSLVGLNPEARTARLIQEIARAKLDRLITSTTIQGSTQAGIEPQAGPERALEQIDKKLDTVSNEILKLDTNTRAKQQIVSTVQEIQADLKSPELASPKKVGTHTNPSDFPDVAVQVDGAIIDVTLHLSASHLGWTKVGTNVTSQYPLWDFKQPQPGGGSRGRWQRNTEDPWIAAQLTVKVGTVRQIKLNFRRHGGSSADREKDRDVVLRELVRNQRTEQQIQFSPVSLALHPGGSCEFTRESGARNISSTRRDICYATQDGPVSALCDHRGAGMMTQGSGQHYLEFLLSQVSSAGVELGVCTEALANARTLPGCLTENGSNRVSPRTEKATAFAYSSADGIMRVGGQVRRGTVSQMKPAKAKEVIGLLLDLRQGKTSLSVYKQDRTTMEAHKNGTEPRAELCGTVDCPLTGSMCWFVTTKKQKDMVQLGRASDYDAILAVASTE